MMLGGMGGQSGGGMASGLKGLNLGRGMPGQANLYSRDLFGLQGGGPGGMDSSSFYGQGVMMDQGGMMNPDAYNMQGNSGNGSVGGGGGNISSGENMALSIPVNLQQLSSINNHLFNIQSMSGAQINISPGAQGLFHLVVTGGKNSVETARSLIGSVIGPM